ncbi:MAG TPA: hypothetical protein VFG21_06805 [Xanthomonadaceae bacterium]|nr:hypothetical protein [Xanthomonadaceae bacterium]
MRTPTAQGVSLPAALLMGAVAIAGTAQADQVTLEPVADTSIYSEDADVSNGAGQALYAGLTRRGDLRRALLRFDVAAAVPPGATIEAASLQVRVSRSVSGPLTATLHRLTADWGEAGSDAGLPGGQGAAAAEGDATWTWRHYLGMTGVPPPEALWTLPGGDFVAIGSATALVGDVGTYAWSGPGMVADIESWLADPAADAGWIVRVAETTPGSAKQFDSREHPLAANRPQLLIDFTPGASVPPPVRQPAVIPAAGLPVLFGLAILVGLLGATVAVRRRG